MTTQSEEPSFEEVLADPMYQSGYDHELLPHLLGFVLPDGRRVKVEECRCAAAHVAPCGAPAASSLRGDDQ